MVFNKINILSILIFTILYSSLIAQLDNSIIDKVPRDRLVTNDELFNLLDGSNPGLTEIITNKDEVSLINYFNNRSKPKYFFDHINFSLRVNEYFSKYPGEKERIIENVSKNWNTYGDDIDWLLPGYDQYGRALTPNTIRHAARFKDALEYSLSSYIDDFNYESKKKLMNQLDDFIKDYESGEVESEENDVFERFYAGHRIRNILFAHNILLGNSDYSTSKQLFIIKFFLLHGAKLIDVCKDFHWGNHQLHGLAGLYELTTMYPEFPVMRHWNKLALNTIMQHIETEIKSDGFQFERASHYFKLDIMNYFRIYKISQLNNIKLPEIYTDRFHQMFEAFVNLSMPNRKLPVLQDAQAIYKSQLDSLENNDAAELSDPSEQLYMTIGSIVFDNPIYKYFGASVVPSQIYWFFNNDEIEKYESITPVTPSVGSVALTDSKYFVMRSGWEQDSKYLLIDGGLAEHKPDHTHGGILGLLVNIGGTNIIPTYRVRYSEPTYRYLKNSFAKNVALADNIAQGHQWKSNNARTGFGHWEILPQPNSTDWIAGENFDYYSGTHNAFVNNGVSYNRSVIYFKPNIWLVLDDFTSESLHNYQQLWQGDYIPLEDCNGAYKKAGNYHLYLIQSDYSNMTIEPYEKYGYKSIKFEKEGTNNYSFSTVVYADLMNRSDKPIVREFERQDYKQIVVEEKSNKSIYYMNKRKKLKLDEINTDARLVFASYNNDQLKSYLVYDGTFCNLDNVSTSVEEKSTFEVNINNDGKVNIIKYNPKL